LTRPLWHGGGFAEPPEQEYTAGFAGVPVFFIKITEREL